MRSRLKSLGFGLVAVVGCGGSAVDTRVLPSTNEAFGDQALGSCPANRSDPQLDLMGWNSGDRATAKILRYSGVVAVRYEAMPQCGAHMVLLSNCIGEGAYFYTPHSFESQKIVNTEAELRASLPLAVDSFGGSVGGERALRTDFKIVGIAALPPGSSYSSANLHGTGCEQATHIVQRFYLGGFGMLGGMAAELKSGGSLFGIGVEAHAKHSAEGLLREGSPANCKSALETGLPTQLCDVPVRVDLLPLSDSAAKSQPAEIWKRETRCAVDIGNGASNRTNAIAGRGGYFYNFADKLGTTMSPAPGKYQPTEAVARIRGHLSLQRPAFAGLGLNFQDPVSFYDASAYTGIAFEAKAQGTARIVRVGVPDRSTAPDGNVCTQCYNDFGASIEPRSAWQEFRIPFAQMQQQPGFGVPRPHAIDPRGVTGIIFSVNSPDQDYDLSVRNIRFLGCAGEEPVPRR